MQLCSVLCVGAKSMLTGEMKKRKEKKEMPCSLHSHINTGKQAFAETQYATRPGARTKRREVALGRLGFEPGRMRAWLS
jgi:hypothetical protein